MSWASQMEVLHLSVHKAGTCIAHLSDPVIATVLLVYTSLRNQDCGLLHIKLAITSGSAFWTGPRFMEVTGSAYSSHRESVQINHTLKAMHL